jgi:hypothetical protein
MYCLSKDQIARVAGDVENEGINFSHLGADLTDHICCEIEQHMDKGLSFAEAYGLVKKEFGIRGLRQIQQDTLLLIDKNYRIMKNSMKTIGVLALALMAFAALFKIMHWPFAGFMLVISFAVLAFVFYPALLYIMYRDVNKKKLLGVYLLAYLGGAMMFLGILFKIMHWPFANYLFFHSLAIIAYVLLPLIVVVRYRQTKISKGVFVSGMVSMIIIITGLIFKVMHWPGAGLALDIGAVVLVLVFVPLFYLNEVRKSETLRIDYLFGVVVITFFIVFTFLQTLSGKTDMQEGLDFQSKSFRENALMLQQLNNSLTERLEQPEAVLLMDKADSASKQIDYIKTMIVQASYRITMEEAAKHIQGDLLFSRHLSNVDFLFNENAESKQLSELKARLQSFAAFCKTMFTERALAHANPNKLFGFQESYSNYQGQAVTWEWNHFHGQEPSAALHTLIYWQYQLRLLQNMALATLSNSSVNQLNEKP